MSLALPSAAPANGCDVIMLVERQRGIAGLDSAWAGASRVDQHRGAERHRCQRGADRVRTRFTVASRVPRCRPAVQIGRSGQFTPSVRCRHTPSARSSGLVRRRCTNVHDTLPTPRIGPARCSNALPCRASERDKSRGRRRGQPGGKRHFSPRAHNESARPTTTRSAHGRPEAACAVARVRRRDPVRPIHP